MARRVSVALSIVLLVAADRASVLLKRNGAVPPSNGARNAGLSSNAPPSRADLRSSAIIR